MAHFAKLDVNNIVTQVVVLHNNELLDENNVEQESLGIQFLHNMYKDSATWKQTSYNTFAGAHRLGGTPFRKNYAGIGKIYDETKDAFMDQQPFPSWTLNEDTCNWEPPVPYPNELDENGPIVYRWDESITNWIV